MEDLLLIVFLTAGSLCILFEIIYRHKKEKMLIEEEKRLIEKEKMDKIEDEIRYRRERNILIRSGQRKRGKKYVR